MNIEKTKKAVLKILEEHRGARSNDFVLYAYVLAEKGVNLRSPVANVLFNANELKLPAFGTVTRCRRKIQQERKDLVEEVTAETRKQAEEEFRQYFHQTH